jgi:hypothetical protein
VEERLSSVETCGVRTGTGDTKGEPRMEGTRHSRSASLTSRPVCGIPSGGLVCHGVREKVCSSSVSFAFRARDVAQSLYLSAFSSQQSETEKDAN